MRISVKHEDYCEKYGLENGYTYHVEEESENYYIYRKGAPGSEIRAVPKIYVNILVNLDDIRTEIFVRCALCGCNESEENEIQFNDDNIAFCPECKEIFDKDGYKIFL